MRTGDKNNRSRDLLSECSNKPVVRAGAEPRERALPIARDRGVVAEMSVPGIVTSVVCSCVGLRTGGYMCSSTTSLS